MPSGCSRMRSTIWRDGLALDRQAGGGRIGHADAREQQAQVVVDLGDGADGGARVLRGRLLLDGDRRRQPVDVVDVGLLHHLEELARVGRQALDVAALALGVDRVEGERGLARARQPREDDQRVARDLQVDVLQVVLARAADVDRLGIRRGRGHRCRLARGRCAAARLLRGAHECLAPAPPYVGQRPAGGNATRGHVNRRPPRRPAGRATGPPPGWPIPGNSPHWLAKLTGYGAASYAVTATLRFLAQRRIDCPGRCPS